MRSRVFAAALASAALVLVVPGAALAQDGSTLTAAADPPPEKAPEKGSDPVKSAEAEKPKAPKTTDVTKGPFTVVLELTGTLDAKEQWDVEVDTESWNGELEVEDAAQPGPVEKGAVLARFKTDKIDEAIAAAEREFALAKLNLQKQTDDAKRADETAALALQRAQWDLAGAELSWTRWQEYEKAFRQLDMDLRLQNQKDSLADAAEELAQLEKMYKADDLTEETEEIVLRRNKRDFERRQKYFTMFTKRDEAWRGQDYAREAENAEYAVKKARMDVAKQQLAATVAQETAKIEFEKAKVAFAKQEEKLGELKADRELFVLRAPESGWAARGSLSRGKWSGTEEPSASLKKEGKVKPHQTLFTIVRPGDVYVRTQAGEASVFSLAEGQTAEVAPNAAPKMKIAAKVTRVAKVASGGDFDVFLELSSTDARFMPGHTAKVKVTTAQKDAALTVPAGSVEKDGDKRFVHVWVNDKTEKREVDAGETSGGRTEILSGVSEGDDVLESPPKAK